MTAGTLDPSAYLITGSGANTLDVTGTILIGAPTFLENYTSFETINLNAGSIVNYSRAGDQTVDNGLNYSNLTISGSGTKTLGGITTVAQALYVNYGTLATGAYTLDVAGDLTVKGTLSGAGIVTLSGDTKIIYGSGTISAPLTISANHTIYSASRMTISGALTINNTKTLTNNGTVTVSSLAGTGTWLQGANSSLTYSGASITPTFTASASLNTVTYINPSAATVLPITYYNLTLNCLNSTFTLGGNTVVAGNLTITAGTLDVTGSDYSLNVAGNWSNSGTFNGRAGTVTLDGTNQTITGNTTFHNLSKSKALADSTNYTLTFTAGSTTTIEDTLTIHGFNASNKILLVSSTPGTRWNICPSATRTLDYMTVTDSNNTASTIINEYSDSTVTDGGNNMRWAFSTTSLFTWTGSTSTSWNTGSNWLGGVVPSASDIAVFGSLSPNNSLVDTNASVAGLSITSAYTGTITQGAGCTITIGAGGYTQSGGTFAGGSSDLTVNGGFNISYGSFTHTGMATFTSTSVTTISTLPTSSFQNVTLELTPSETMQNALNLKSSGISRR